MFKMKTECKNCGWEGEYDGKVVIGNLAEEVRFCPLCGDNIMMIGDDNVGLDLNKDGKVDKKDAKIASRVMNHVKKKVARKRKVPGRKRKRQ